MFRPLDVLREVSGARGFDELLPYNAEVSDSELKLRVLNLPMQIKAKAEVNRLIATLEERQKPRSNE